MVQLYRAINDYCGDHYSNLPSRAQRQIYPTVVTLEDWYFFGMELPDRLDAAVRDAMASAGLPVTWPDNMPYSVMSVDEFEKVSGVLNIIGLNTFMNTTLQDLGFRRCGFGPYCIYQYRGELALMPDLFQDEYDQMFAELECKG